MFRDIGLACVSAILLVLSFPSFDFGGVAWVSLVPLLLALEGKGLKEGFFLSFVTVSIFISVSSYWIWATPFNIFDYLILGAYLFIFYGGGFGLGLNWIRTRTGFSQALVAPPLWVSLEYVRAHMGFLSAPWLLLGYSQYQYPPVIQLASITGVYGITFLIVLVNATIAQGIRLVPLKKFRSTPNPLIHRRFFVQILITGILLMGTLLYGQVVISRGISGDRITLAVIQTTVPRDWRGKGKGRRSILINNLRELTLATIPQNPQLIIWPETAVRGSLKKGSRRRRQVAEIASQAGTYILAGGGQPIKFRKGEEKIPSKFYNSMFLFSPNGTVEGQYNKVRLVPFGEYAPLRDIVTWPEFLAPVSDRVIPGDEFSILQFGDTRLGVVICWETNFPDLFRKFIQRGAQVMVNGTNESWFVGTTGVDHFLIMTAFRAVENRVAVARAANLGISAIIDPFGRITQRMASPYVEGALVGEVALAEGPSFYTLYGDVFTFSQIVFCVLTLLYSWRRPHLSQRFVSYLSNLTNRTRV